MTRRALSTLVLALAVGSPFVAATPATAQFGGNTGFAEAFKPDYYARDITLFNEYLDLEEWQRPIVESLLEDYSSSFRAGMDAMKDKMQNVKDEIASRGAAGVMPLLDGWIQEKAKLRVEFLENVKSQLSEAQLLRWPRFERAFHRDKMLHLGELSGESVNLIVLLKEISLDAATQKSIEPTLEAYELELEEALSARDAMMTQQQPKIQQAMVSGDNEAGISAVERIMQTRVRVRDANDRGAAAIAEALPADRKAEFLKRWRETAYPKIFRGANQLDRYFDAARELAGLTDEQKRGIDAIEVSYVERGELIGRDAMTILHNEEPKDARRKAEATKGRANKGGGRNPEYLAEVNQRREQLADETRAQVEALLGPELSAKLPGANKIRTSVPEPAKGDGAKGDGTRGDRGRGDRSERLNRGGRGGDGGLPGGASAPPAKAAD